MTYRRKRVTVMGLGHFGGGVAVARWLASQGAVVTVTDLADETTLVDSLAALDGVPIARTHLGGHREDDFRDVDLVVVNPAVRPGNRLLEIARQSGARLSSEIELFLEATAARIIGVTGSSGKSTTAAMTAAILRAAGQNVWLGGNIGQSLLDRLDRIGSDDWVVLELSSFQLWHLGQEGHLGPHVSMPQIAVITGCTPNHLDWHADYEQYKSAKQRLLVGQSDNDSAVLNTYDPEVRGWCPMVRGKLLPPARLDEIPRLSVPGEHNRINAALAVAAARAAGCGEAAVLQGLQSYEPLEQRLEQLATVEGRTFYNDSASTTPESTVAALRSVDRPVWLLAGGRDKGSDFEQMATSIVDEAQGAAFFGTVAQRLQSMTTAGAPQFNSIAAETLDEAFSWCWQSSRPGDAIVLSPGCASSDQFQNYRARGECFAQLVRALDNRDR
ncbi:MAG: UDP-N-acetylmuramoyl-L-alanine--D-glutamate ligase [Thermoguttaceae bacterium]